MKISIIVVSLTLAALTLSKISYSQTTWEEMGSVALALQANNYIATLAIDASGNVYAAGNFRNASNKCYVAKWEGNGWQELGSINANFNIGTLATDPAGNVYAAGDFFNSSTQRYVAKWNGSNWQELGNLNANEYIRQLASDNNGQIYAAGHFTNGLGFYYVARWDGNSWQELGTGANALNANGPIYSIQVDKFGHVYAAGNFKNAAGKCYVAKWDGVNWQELGTGGNSLSPSSTIFAVAIDSSGFVYAAGAFAGTGLNRYVARWDGTTWQPLGTGAQGLNANNSILDLHVDAENNLYAAGNFTDGTGKAYVARWLSSSWMATGTDNYSSVSNNYINAISMDMPGNIYKAGGFTNPAGKFYVGKFSWQQPPLIVNFSPLYAGSGATVFIKGDYFTGASAVTFNGIPATSFEVVSDSVIKAIVPVSTSGPIAITTTYGNSISQSLFYNRPTIFSFSPATAKMNEIVQINGRGFSATPSLNIVLFGNAKAEVLAATDTTLMVKVPSAATYAPISVTQNAVIGSSLQWFIPGFTPGPLTSKSFRHSGNFKGHSDGKGFSLADLNNDGKPDVIAADDSVAVMKNTSTGSSISFAPKKIFSKSSAYTLKPAVVDIDGDGNLDIISCMSTSVFNDYYLNVLRNTSTVTDISFAQTAIPSPRFGWTVTADLDEDGKADVICLQLGAPYQLYIYRNISSVGNVAFQAPIILSSGAGSNDYNINVADLNGDGKVDISYSNGNANSFSILKNLSSPGLLSFAPMVAVPAPSYPGQSAVADFDNDGKMDIILKNGDSRNFSIFRNTSTINAFSFLLTQHATPLNNAVKFKTADIDGDNKIDIAFINTANNFVSILKNTSAAANISFAPQVDNLSGYNVVDIDIADMNADGKPDLTVMNNGIFTVLKNVLAEPIIYSFEPRKTDPGATITIKGTSFTGSSAVNFGSMAATSFNVISDSVIEATLAGSLEGEVAVTNTFGTGTLTNWYPIPAIREVLPSSGKVGETVVVKGENFKNFAGDIFVRFGHMSATVLSSTDSTVTVLVPKGFSYATVSVTTNKLTATSTKYFNLRFSNGHQNFRANSFETPKTYDAGFTPGGILLNDLNEDHKPDLLVSYESFGSDHYYFTNNSDSAAVRFEVTPDYKRINAFSDMDGDGKTDIVFGGISGSGIDKNITEAESAVVFDQTISNYFESETQAPYTFSGAASIADINRDGNPDVITSFGHLNKSTEALISLIPFEYKTNITTHRAHSADFDNDGLVDILALNQSSTTGIQLVRNISASSNVAFANPFSLPTSLNTYQADIADLDSDGKLDIVVTNRNNNRIALYRNNSVPGSFSFQAVVYQACGVSPTGVKVADINGDGKPDIAVANSGDNTFSLIKNNSVPGSFSFSTQVKYTTGLSPRAIVAADFDIDGVTDIAVTNFNSNTVSVFINRQAKPSKIVLCPSVDNGFINPDIFGSSYQWQISTDTITYTNLANNANYAGVNSQTLLLSNIPSTWYGYRYRCIVNGANSSIYSLQFANTWAGTVSNDWLNPANWSCGTLPDSNTDVFVTSGAVVLTGNTSIRSITVGPNASVTINPGIILNITN